MEYPISSSQRGGFASSWKARNISHDLRVSRMFDMSEKSPSTMRIFEETSIYLSETYPLVI